MTRGILGSSPGECFQQFREHVQKLVAQTLHARPPILAVEFKDPKSGQQRAHLTFREHGPVTIPIDTEVGKLHFYVWQELGVERIEQSFRLNTLKYQYRIQETSSIKDADALIRWEYDKTQRADKKRPCRHHVQMTGHLGSAQQLDLNKLHTPTGWVLIEEVMRFLIHDLGVSPPCGNDWPEILSESEERFYGEFTSKDVSGAS